MKFDSKSIRKRWGSLTTALCTAVLLYVALNHLNLIFGSIGKVLGFASPVFTGLIIAYIVDPLVMLFQNYILRGSGGIRFAAHYRCCAPYF